MRKLLAVTALALAATPAQADPVTAWMEAVQGFQRAANAPAGTLITDRFTPANVAVHTRVAAAMFEAANAADRRFDPYFGLAPAPRTADVEAAIMSAAHGVLAASFPQRKAELDASLAVSLAGRPAGAALDEGLRLGREAASMAMARQVFDPAVSPLNYVPEVAEGSYAGPNEGVGIPFIFGYKPWLLPSIDAIEVPPMPGLETPAFRASVEETRTLGARNSKVRTGAQSASARFWIDGLDHLPTLRNLAAKPGARLVDIARLNALVTLADFDSYHVVDINKMRLMRWRPVTAIRVAGKKANDHGAAGTGWEPYLRTPASSEYPCGHCTGGGVMGALMQAELGDYSEEAEFRSDEMPGAVVRGMRWSDFPRIISNSRIWGGVHFRYSADVGESIGKEIARLARSRFARPLPGKT